MAQKGLLAVDDDDDESILREAREKVRVIRVAVSCEDRAAARTLALIFCFTCDSPNT
jgi:hypothetical protein